MQLDARELDQFYRSPLGLVARRLIARAVRGLWPTAAGQRVLGFGFATPYLRRFRAEAERVVAFMPGQQGVIAWPPGERALSLLGDEEALPFPDALFDRILVVHGLEGSDAGRALLRQLWRVLAPEGRILIVAPNRASLWAQLASSPFGQGRPFHRTELETLLRGAMFVPERWARALYVPPAGGWLLGSGLGWDRLGRRLYPGLAGVHLVEASKSLYALPPPLPSGRKSRVLVRAQGL